MLRFKWRERTVLRVVEMSIVPTFHSTTTSSQPSHRGHIVAGCGGRGQSDGGLDILLVPRHVSVARIWCLVLSVAATCTAGCVAMAIPHREGGSVVRVSFQPVHNGGGMAVLRRLVRGWVPVSRHVGGKLFAAVRGGGPTGRRGLVATYVHPATVQCLLATSLLGLSTRFPVPSLNGFLAKGERSVVLCEDGRGTLNRCACMHLQPAEALNMHTTQHTHTHTAAQWHTEMKSYAQVVRG